MIRIPRATGEPPALSGQRARKAWEQAARFFGSRSKQVLQSQHEFDRGLLELPSLHRALGRVFSHRCAFCGRGEATTSLETHHFRPPEGAVAADGSSSRRHYWWLAYRWENLYLACSECRKAQGQKFPVSDRRARVGSGPEALAKESPLLLDPVLDDPEQVLVYLDSGEIVSGDARGKATIDTFELNRRRLVKERAVAIEQTNWDIGHLGEALKGGDHDFLLQLLRELYDPAKPLAGLRRQRVNQWVQFRPRKLEAALWNVAGSSDALDQLVGDLRRVTNRTKEEEARAFFGEAAPFYLGPERPVETERRSMLRTQARAVLGRDQFSPQRLRKQEPWTYLDSAEIRAIEIRNFRAIEHISLEMTEGPGEGSWLMLLGENGTGKSSILQAIGLVLSDTETIKTYADEAQHLLRKGAEWGQVRVELTGQHRFRELRFGKGYRGFEADRAMEGVLVAGYGASRLLPRSRRAPAARSKIDGLFDPFVPLSRPSSWLPELDETQFDAVARALKRLLSLSDAETMRLVDGDICLTKGRQRLRLADLSDGYQAMAGFGLDLMELFLGRWGSLEAAEGVVLLDELGAHLHPRWQMRVTGLLRAAFPRVQFVATTHDPLCLQGLRNGEVALLRRTGDHVYALHHELPPVEGLAVDQILTSEHFGLHSTRDPAVEELLREYYSLLAMRRRGARRKRRLQDLQAELESYGLLGTTRRERLALQAADEFIAAQPLLTSGEEYMALRLDTVERIRAIWESRLR